MKKLFTGILVGLLGLATTAFAQTPGSKTYVAKVESVSAAAALPKRDKDEITFQAKSTLKNLLDLLTQLTNSDLTETERNALIQNSYLPNQNQAQLFYNDAVIIEDDVDPKHTSSDNTADLQVDRYLRDLDLFYVKSDAAPTIFFSQQVASPVLQDRDYAYIKIFFTSKFTGKRTDSNTPYQPQQRVVELRAEPQANNTWRTFITRISFLRAGDGLSEAGKTTLTTLTDKSRTAKGKDVTFQRTDGKADEVVVRWDNRLLSVMRSSLGNIATGSYERSSVITEQMRAMLILSPDERQLTFTWIDNSKIAFTRLVEPPPGPDKRKLVAWLQILTGTAALGASYLGYSAIRRDYDAYTTRMSGLNAEYAIWQELTQQPGGSSQTPMSFGSYAQPGIYAIYGGGAVGSGLILNGIRMLFKAGR